MIKDLPVDIIDPSPYQNRRQFADNKLRELANSIKRDGLIEPIVVRPVDGRYELIAGERRLRACKIAELPTILSRTVEVCDLQARRMCAAENLQREDLSAVEEVEAIVEMVDAELVESEEYQGFGDEPKKRVKKLLSILASVEDSGRNSPISAHSEVNHNIYNKFIIDIVGIFTNLPKSIDWRSFYNNDFLPLAINLDSEVAQVAAENKLNKSQIKALNEVKKENPEAFKEISTKTNGNGQAQVSLFNENLERENVPLGEVSAREIKKLSRRVGFIPDEDRSHLLISSSRSNEWYTPLMYVDAARKVMGSIDLDPASNPIANKTVRARTYYTQETNGLDKLWEGNVWLNPPWGDLTEKFVSKLVKEWEEGNLSQAIALVNAHATDTKWFSPLWDYLLCFTDHRIDYYSSTGIRADSTSTHGSVFVYFGDNHQGFIDEFKKFGAIVKRVD